MKSKLTKFHFYLLAVLVGHFIFAKVIGFGFNQTIVFVLKIILYISGLILFVYHLKPFKKVSFYFSYYIITPIVSILGYLFGGVFLVGILMAILISPIYPKQVVYKKDNFVIYNKFQGFMGVCCKYEIYENKYFLFEIFRGEIENDPVNIETFELLNDKEIERLRKEPN